MNADKRGLFFVSFPILPFFLFLVCSPIGVHLRLSADLFARREPAANSPKATWRGLGEIGVLNPQQVVAALAMTDDRNLTSHTNNESLAREIFGRLSEHAALLAALLKEIRVRLV